MKPKTVKPLWDQILVKPDPAEEQTKGGIYIPGSAQEKPLRGEIIAIGKGKRDKDGKFKGMHVDVGQKVYYTKNFTEKVMHNGSEHLLMIEERVLLIDERP